MQSNFQLVKCLGVLSVSDIRIDFFSVVFVESLMSELFISTLTLK